MHLFSRAHTLFFRKIISTLLVVTFTLSMGITPSQAQLPPIGQMVWLTPGFQPPVLRGMTVHPENPLLFDFIVDRGQDKIDNTLLKEESTKLIKYFLASMTIPDKDAWVNLSPYEKDRIVPDALGQTEMGRQMLEQDYVLKQLAASLTNPDKDLGKKFWNEVKSRAQKQFGTTEIPLNTFNKVWIMPDGATVVEKDGFAYITESKLKIMLDEDVIARSEATKQSEIASPSAKASQGEPNGRNDISTQVFREMILPQLVKEVNEGKNFAATRQVYQSVILASWYKKALKDSLLGRIYANKNKIEGVESDDKDIKQKVYDQYLEAFKKGVYNVIKEEGTGDDLIPRKYFSGGLRWDVDVAIDRSSSSVNAALAQVTSGAASGSSALIQAAGVESLAEAAAQSSASSGVTGDFATGRDRFGKSLASLYPESEIGKIAPFKGPESGYLRLADNQMLSELSDLLKQVGLSDYLKNHMAYTRLQITSQSRRYLMRGAILPERRKDGTTVVRTEIFIPDFRTDDIPEILDYSAIDIVRPLQLVEMVAQSNQYRANTTPEERAMFRQIAAEIVMENPPPLDEDTLKQIMRLGILHETGEPLWTILEAKGMSGNVKAKELADRWYKYNTNPDKPSQYQAYKGPIYLKNLMKWLVNPKDGFAANMFADRFVMYVDPASLYYAVGEKLVPEEKAFFDDVFQFFREEDQAFIVKTPARVLTLPGAAASSAVMNYRVRLESFDVYMRTLNVKHDPEIKAKGIVSIEEKQGAAEIKLGQETYILSNLTALMPYEGNIYFAYLDPAKNDEPTFGLLDVDAANMLGRKVRQEIFMENLPETVKINFGVVEASSVRGADNQISVADQSVSVIPGTDIKLVQPRQPAEGIIPKENGVLQITIPNQGRYYLNVRVIPLGVAIDHAWRAGEAPSQVGRTSPDQVKRWDEDGKLVIEREADNIFTVGYKMEFTRQQDGNVHYAVTLRTYDDLFSFSNYGWSRPQPRHRHFMEFEYEGNVSRRFYYTDQAYGLSAILDKQKDERVNLLLVGVGWGVTAIELALKYPHLHIVAVNKQILWDAGRAVDKIKYYQEINQEQIDDALSRIEVVEELNIEDKYSVAMTLSKMANSDGKFDMVFFETNVATYLADEVLAVQQLFNVLLKNDGFMGFEIYHEGIEQIKGSWPDELRKAFENRDELIHVYSGGDWRTHFVVRKKDAEPFDSGLKIDKSEKVPFGKKFDDNYVLSYRLKGKSNPRASSGVRTNIERERAQKRVWITNRQLNQHHFLTALRERIIDREDTVRVANGVGSAREGIIEAFDDSDSSYPTITLRMSTGTDVIDLNHITFGQLIASSSLNDIKLKIEELSTRQNDPVAIPVELRTSVYELNDLNSLLLVRYKDLDQGRGFGVHEERMVSVQEYVELAANPSIVSLHISEIHSSADPVKAKDIPAEVMQKFADNWIEGWLPLENMNSIAAVVVEFQSGYSVLASGNAKMLIDIAKNPDVRRLENSSGKPWMKSIDQIPADQRKAGYNWQSEYLNQIQHLVKLLNQTDLIGKNVAHGTLEGFVDSIKEGPLDTGKGMGGVGLYVDLDQDFRAARLYALYAHDEAPVRIAMAKEKFTGSANPIVMVGRITDKPGLKVASFELDRNISSPDFQKGILPQLWADDPNLQKVMMDAADILDITGMPNVSGFNMPTERMLVVHSSAGQMIEWKDEVIPVGQSADAPAASSGVAPAVRARLTKALSSVAMALALSGVATDGSTAEFYDFPLGPNRLTSEAVVLSPQDTWESVLRQKLHGHLLVFGDPKKILAESFEILRQENKGNPAIGSQIGQIKPGVPLHFQGVNNYLSFLRVTKKADFIDHLDVVVGGKSVPVYSIISQVEDVTGEGNGGISLADQGGILDGTAAAKTVKNLISDIMKSPLPELQDVRKLLEDIFPGMPERDLLLFMLTDMARHEVLHSYYDQSLYIQPVNTAPYGQIFAQAADVGLFGELMHEVIAYSGHTALSSHPRYGVILQQINALEQPVENSPKSMRKFLIGRIISDILELELGFKDFAKQYRLDRLQKEKGRPLTDEERKNESNLLDNIWAKGIPHQAGDNFNMRMAWIRTLKEKDADVQAALKKAIKIITGQELPFISRITFSDEFIDKALATQRPPTEKSTQLTPDSLAITPGGIDFDPSKLNLQIKRDGRGVPLPLPQQNLENIDIKGLYPVIINIMPINTQTLPILGQLSAQPDVALSKS